MAVVLIAAILGLTVITCVFIMCQARVRLAELELRRRQIELDRAGVVTPEQVTEGLSKAIVRQMDEAELMNFRFPPSR